MNAGKTRLMHEMTKRREKKKSHPTNSENRSGEKIPDRLRCCMTANEETGHENNLWEELGEKRAKEETKKQKDHGPGKGRSRRNPPENAMCTEQHS